MTVDSLPPTQRSTRQTGDPVIIIGPEPRGRHANNTGEGLLRLVSWTTIGTLIPGAAFLAAGRKRTGIILLVGAVLSVVALVASAVVVGLDPTKGAAKVGGLITGHPNLTYVLAGVVAALTLGWMLMVWKGYRALRRNPLFPFQNVVAGVLVGALMVGVATQGAYGVQTAVGLHKLGSVFGNSDSNTGPVLNTATKDPWDGIQRVNLLLIGSDADEDRRGMRTDSLTVASVNPKTGQTALISIPRNLEGVKFPEGTPGAKQWPKGFKCVRKDNTHCLINEIADWADNNRAAYGAAGKDPNFPLRILMDVVGVALGIKIDQWVMVSIGGFRDVVNLMGGLQINLKRDIPVGIEDSPIVDRWIKAGNHKFDGEDALWIARSRKGSSDYDRMRRQRCVLDAFSAQVNAAELAKSLPKLIDTVTNHVATSVPAGQIPAYVDLMDRIKKGDRTALTLDDTVIRSGNPDWDKIHTLVQEALSAPPKPATATTATATPSMTQAPTATPTPSFTTGRNGKKTPVPVTSTHEPGGSPVVELADVC